MKESRNSIRAAAATPSGLEWTRVQAAGTALLAALLLAGCTAYAPPAGVVGRSAAEVEQAMGPATARHTLADGRTRLEFARGPMGRHTWMVDLGPDGRVQSTEQVLTERHFATLRDGDTRASVLQRFGRPSDVRGGGRQGGEVWSWRFDNGNNCLWFQLSMIDGRVQHPAYAIDPHCDAGGNDRS